MTDNLFRLDLTVSCGNCLKEQQQWIGMDIEIDEDNEQIIASCPRCNTSVYIDYTMMTEESR